MGSIIPGFEYDIFISYRHKDNKYDGWVNDFVDNLRRELEATFKEEISLYFDENNHDGLLETHNVDKSLEGKLKCLVFIPIISQTYCDPKSFAWRHEFLAFIERAREDEFGMDIRLANGNVCSRVLAVRIHDLDAKDKALLETELRGVLRPVDFIYKSAGVNRPLRTTEDNPSSNLTKAFYRDQINKVANTVKDIVQGMENHNNPLPITKSSKTKSDTTKRNPIKRVVARSLLGLFLVALGLSGYYWLTNLQHKKELSAIRKGSIAILPFENQTGRSNLNSVGQVSADFISTQLIRNQFFKVIPTQDVFRQTVYSGVLTNPEAQKKIVNEGNIDYLVIGHYNLIEDSILLVVSVNDVLENKVLYTTPVIKCEVANPMKAVTEAQQFILGFLMFSKTEKASASTRPPKYDAYQEYLIGMELWTKNEIGPGNIVIRTSSEIERHFKTAVSMDEDFLLPYFKLAQLFSIDRKFNRLDSVLQILSTKQNLFLEDDLINFNIQKLLLSRDWDELENFLLTKTNAGTSDFRPYYQLAVNALYRQNKPMKALDYVAQCDLSEFDFDNKPSDQLLYSVQFQALIKLRRFDEVVKITDKIALKSLIPPVRTQRWLCLVYTHKNEQVNKESKDILGNAKMTRTYHFPNMSLFRAGQLLYDTVLMKNQYLQFEESITGIDEDTKKTTWISFVEAVMMFRIKTNMSEAENRLSQNLPVVSPPRRMQQLGILYAATHRPEKANEIIQKLLSVQNEFNKGNISYYVAKIETELGHKEKAIDYLRKSIEGGMEYGDELFEFDADLRELLNYPPFIDLVRPKE